MKIISMATLAPMYPTFQKYGAGKILHMFFFKQSLMLTKTVCMWSKHSKNRYIAKYHNNLKERFSIGIYFKM